MKREKLVNIFTVLYIITHTYTHMQYYTKPDHNFRDPVFSVLSLYNDTAE